MDVEESGTSFKSGAQRQVGWAHTRVSWPTSEQALAANAERRRLLAALPPSVKQVYAGTKIRLGPLSPGCRICAEGTWLCLFISSGCTRSCFYCPQDRVEKTNRSRSGVLPREIANDADSLVDFLERFGYRGVAFSGGEPLLALDQIVDYTTRIRARFGADFYVWMYTNGDLLTEEGLAELKAAGLDEIRINLSANDYSPRSIELARKYFDVVSVEVPAVPEELELLQARLGTLVDLGVKYINLHQLVANEHNMSALAQRPYVFLHQPLGAVLESELGALRLIAHCAREQLPLAIQYCSETFKTRFQGQGHRQRLVTRVLESAEEETPIGYIRRMTVRTRGRPLSTLASELERLHGTSSIFWREGQDELRVTSRTLGDIDLAEYTLGVTYYRATVICGDEPEEASTQPEAPCKDVQLRTGRTVCFRRTISWQAKEFQRIPAEGFRLLICNQGETGRALRGLLALAGSIPDTTTAKFQEAIELVGHVAWFERLEEGLPEIA